MTLPILLDRLSFTDPNLDELWLEAIRQAGAGPDLGADDDA